MDMTGSTEAGYSLQVGRDDIAILKSQVLKVSSSQGLKFSTESYWWDLGVGTWDLGVGRVGPCPGIGME